MKFRKLTAAGLLLGGLTATPLAAQVPGFSGGAPIAPAGAVPAAPAAPNNLYSFLCPTADQLAACRQKLCNCAMGQLLNNMLKPAGALTGGMIGPFCQDNLAPGLAAPPESLSGAAARIKKDAADAKKRIADIRYLANVDCHYWPEAQGALIGALRADRVECVRYEAALALTHGCCCTKDVVKALIACINCNVKDGNPSETSERVRAQAAIALENCLSKCPDLNETDKPMEMPKPPVAPLPMGDRKALNDATQKKENLAEEARRALAKAPAPPAKRGGSLFEIMGITSTPEAVPVGGMIAKTSPAGAAPGMQTVAVVTPPVAEPMPPVDNPLFRTVSNPKPATLDPNAGYNEVTTLQTARTREERLQALKSLSTSGVNRVDLVQIVINTSCLDEDVPVRLAAFGILPALAVPQPAIEQVANRWILDPNEQIRAAGNRYLKYGK